MDQRMTIPAPDALLEHQAFLRALARSLLRDDQAADDVVQETYIKALDGVPRHGNLRGWLARVTRNFALNALRSDRRRARREQAAARDESLPSVEEGVARLEVHRNVVDAVLALDEPYRSVIVHRFFYELELKEIARRLDLPLETVRTRLRRALARLRGSMDARHHGDRRAWSLALLPLAWPARASAAAATTGGGVLLMSLQAKLAIAALILIALGVLVFQYTRPDPVPERALEAEAASTKEADASTTESEPVGDQPADAATVDRDLDLHGVVVGPEGRPVAGANVQSVRYPNVRAHEVGARSHRPVLGPSAITRSDGRFRLRLARGQAVALRIRAEGFASVERRELQAGARVRIELQPGLELPLQVCDTSGRPLAGAIVFLQPSDTDLAEASDFYFGIRGETDSAGRFVATGLVPCSQRTVIAMHPDFAMNMIMIESVDASVAEDTIIELPEADSVTGLVVDRDTGHPIEGAILSAFPVPYGKTVVTGADGRFEYKGWSQEANLGGALYVLTGSHAMARCAVEPGREARIELERGVALNGRLMDPRGAPVARAYLTAVSGDDMDKDAEVDVCEAESGPDGRFEMPHLRTGHPHTLIILADGFGKTLLDLPASDQPHELGDLRLPGGLHIEGTVLDANGDPVAEHYVNLIGTNRDRSRLIPAGERLQATDTRGNTTEGPPPSAHGSAEDRLTDDLGRFCFGDLAPGDYELQIYLTDGRALSHRVALKDADVTGIDFRAESGWTCAVRVTNEAGEALEGAWIRCSALRIGLATNEKGIARLTLPHEVQRPTVTVSPPAGAALFPVAEVLLRSASDSIHEVRLPAAAWVTGTLLDSGGAPIDGGLIQVRAGRMRNASASTEPDGSFSQRVPAGATAFVGFDGSTRAGYRPLAVDPIRVPPGSGPVVLRARAVESNRKLTVRVVDPEGGPIEGVGIIASPVTEDTRDVPLTDAKGIVVLEGLPDARVGISVFVRGPHPATSGLVPPRVERVVPRGQTLDLRWKEPVRVSGRVQLPDGRPARVDVGLLSRGAAQVLTFVATDVDGRFQLVVPEGEHESVVLVVEPTARGDDPAYADLKEYRLDDVRPGTTGIEIRLETRE